jgi:hypothetical protein
MGVLAVGLCVGTYALQVVRERNRKRRGHRSLQARPERRPAEVADGELVRVRGLSVAEQSLVAPLSGRPCIGYCVALEERLDFSWRRIAQREDFLPFRLAADGVSFEVEGPFLVALKIDTRGERLVTPSPVEAKVLADLGVSQRGFLITKRDLRLREARLEQDDVIWVSGLASIAIDSRGERDTLRGPPMRRVIRGTTQEPTVLADDLAAPVRDLV